MCPGKPAISSQPQTGFRHDRPIRRVTCASSIAAPTPRALFLGFVLLAAACFCPVEAVAATGIETLPAAAPASAGRVIASSSQRADFRQESASAEARGLANWIVASADNHNMPFVIIDKVQARVFVFQPDGQLRGATAALLGSAIGDDSTPGIGERPLSSIRPEERTTPAGRFVASLDRDLHGEEILWVDYETAISLHRVVTSNPRERRAQRLATPTPLDNRISFGCINVPARFYEKVVSPAFTGTNGIAYILPETRSIKDVFGSYEVH